MSKTRLGLVFLLIISLGVLLGSNIITDWTTQVDHSEQEIKRELENNNRQEMRMLLSATSDSIIYDIQENGTDIAEKENVEQIIFKHIAPIANNGLGEMYLFRISPDQKVLYDSSGETVKNGILERCLTDEIIIDESAREILKEHSYDLEGGLNYQSIQRLKDKNYDLYSEIVKFTTYENLDNANYILEQIRIGEPSFPRDNHQWTIRNGTTEMIEWVVIPPGEFGLDNRPHSRWGVNIDNHRWVLLMRVKDTTVFSLMDTIKEQNKQKEAIAKVLYVLLVFVLIASTTIVLYYIEIKKCS